ncbi:MAG: hypothetical protein ANABAC_1005 [Anaerolineae bacterium]|nr:MAG: hypothetical protein ANABAC_1005 [Anaerolineae bacterium]
MRVLDSDLKPVVVLISANAEWVAVKEILKPNQVEKTIYGECFWLSLSDNIHPQEILFFQGGWGKISAAASTQYVIDRYSPYLLFNLGTCGGIEGRIERGQIVLVEKTVVYDLIEMMEDNVEATNAYTTVLDLSFLREPFPYEVKKQTMLSADRDLQVEDIPGLIQKYGASVCDWESAAIAFVTRKNGTPLVILRGVSDLVSPHGGEAYGNVAFFHLSTRSIMRQLVENLSGWLTCIDPARVIDIR